MVEIQLDIPLYLQRLGISEVPTPSPEVLAQLQEAHLKNIPFENLDIHDHVRIDFLNSFEKIIHQNRGGFCYELNYLFYRLLVQLGFKVKLISARVFDKAKGYGAEYDHMAIIAAFTENEYLVDVGLGEFAFHPLLIGHDGEITDPGGIFRISNSEDGCLVVAKKNEAGDFIPEYKFTTIERQHEEFEGMCHYHQTSPESHFTQKRVISIATQNGRITLTDDRLKITSPEGVREYEINTENAFDEMLWEYFNIGISFHRR
jgi:N-hydroxyarylamine O-acetyltransferase